MFSLRSPRSLRLKSHFQASVNFCCHSGIYLFDSYQEMEPIFMRLVAIFTFLLAISITGLGQSTTFIKADQSPAEIDKIISKFTRNEKLFRSVLNVYAFNRNATIQTIGMG